MDEKLNLDKIFRAYDIRGVFPDEFNEKIAYSISHETVNFLKAKTLVVGMDGRESSSLIASAVIKGIEDNGGEVKFLGQATTPLFYFAVNFLNADGGLMVTASHNPSKYNGLKIVSEAAEPIGLENGLEVIKNKIKNQELPEELDYGKLPETTDVVDEYINFILENSGFKVQKTDKFGEIAWQPNPYDFKVGIDAVNGMTGLILPKLFEKLRINYVPLNFEVGKSASDNKILKKIIPEKKLDLGVIFDGDGDRIIFLDKYGNTINSSAILLLLTQDLEKNDLKIVYDITMSKIVREQIETWKGEAIKSIVGHTNIKQKMKETDAQLGGEYTGHFYFKEMNYSESAILAMLKIFYIFSKHRESLDELVKPFDKYFNSGQINFELKGDDDKQKIMELLEKKYSDGKIDKTDGLTIEYQDWWFNIRPSNTEPVIRLVVEADTKELIEQKVKEINNLIQK